MKSPASGAPFPPWRIWEALLVLTLFVLVQVGVSVGMGLVAGGWFNEESGPDAGLFTFLGITLPMTLVLSHAAAWAAIYWLVVRRHHCAFLDGLRLRRYPWFRGVKAFFGGMGMQVLAALLALFIPPPPDFVSPVEEFLRLGSSALTMFFVMAVMLAPLLEEVLFRGLLLPTLRKRHDFALSALLVTVIFTGMHATQTGTYWPPLVGIALCGWALAVLRERSGSLWPPIAFHAGFNFTAFLPIFFIDLHP